MNLKETLNWRYTTKKFELRKKGFTAVVAVSIGYRAKSDFNSTEKPPKSRLSESEIITII
ncbi:nitroreductase / dihydropteridine reductase [Algibacter lectus]|uniref:hypothetical protein n=1 Tax=Algibacter lectus TaxID=221126 RepID=UPI0008F1039D|nr:hypothetical protein [Algibacter lectus]SFD73377.1 nitroreductase / dihydropteridine reductase [Algibacter lectus]